MTDPVDMAVLHAYDIKAAHWYAPAAMALSHLRQEVAGGAQQTQLLAAVYTCGSPAMAAGTAVSDFYEHQGVAVEGHEVYFSGPAQKIAFQYAQTLALQPLRCVAFGAPAGILGR